MLNLVWKTIDALLLEVKGRGRLCFGDHILQLHFPG